MTAPSKADRAGDEPTGPTSDVPPAADAPPADGTPPAAGAPSARAGEEAARLLRRLTPREAQVVARLAAGEDDRAIAAALGISPATARTHLTRAMRKLGVGSRAEAARLAALLGAEGSADRPQGAAAAPVQGPGPPPAAATEPATGPEPGPPPAAAAEPAAPEPAAPEPSAPMHRHTDFAAFSADVHTRLVQQTYLVTGSQHRALHSVRIALGAAALRWEEVAALADPEGFVRAAAFESALSPWRRGGPRRARAHHLPHRAIKVRKERNRRRAVEGRPTPQDKALLTAMHRLTRPQRRAVVLHDAVGLPAEAVAVEVESSTAAAEGRVRAAREELARAVPEVVGTDPWAPGFGPELGALLHGAAVRACPSPRRPSPGLLVVGARRRAHAVTGAAALLTLAMGGAMVAALVVSLQSDAPVAAKPRPAAVAPPPEVCSSFGTGSAGPAAPGREPGLRSPWCNPAAPRASAWPAAALHGAGDTPSGPAEQPAGGGPTADGAPVPEQGGSDRALVVSVPCAPLWPCPTLGPAEVPQLLP
ncbi:LuxR C-terminal-related transcriptional regulator [Kitasatospora sp. NPDC051914]|uniref:LuxR C-terminal-related transcriptional regulator n=1 Tax=Kitasatospora sp. NPDC051914 TaxID=3154945 RepID=UPI0034335F15